MLVDLTTKGLTGKVAEAALDMAGITTNKNGIPFDTQSPFITSGIRIGTPAVTTRGMKEGEMDKIAEFIQAILSDVENRSLQERIKGEVKELCQKFPIYPERLAAYS